MASPSAKPPVSGMDEWTRGQLIRAKRHRSLLMESSFEISVAVGTYHLALGKFKVTHLLGNELPQVGEQLILLKGMKPESPEEEVRITGIVHDVEDGGQVVYSFRREAG